MKILQFIKELFKTVIIGLVALVLVLAICQMATGSVSCYSISGMF